MIAPFSNSQSDQNTVNSDRIVYDEYGNKYTLTDLIGEGGQGAVYRVNQGAGRNLAIKIQKDPESNGILRDDKAYTHTARMVRRIMALPLTDCIASPIAMLQKPYCGYVMRLMEKLSPISKFMVPHSTEGKDLLRDYFESDGGYLKRIKMLTSLSMVMSQIHEAGIVYGDLSPGNIFISEDPAEYQAWLIDVDNLKYESQNDTNIGTPCYMAPEVFNGNPNTCASDCYSFALIAFECLTWSKPFSGTIIFEEPEEDFGECPEDLINTGEISYIYEGDPRNNPVGGFQKNIQYVITDELQDLFMRTFCKQGRINPLSRPKMTDWYKAFVNATYSAILCKSKHYHIGDSCLLCHINGINPDTDTCYTLQTYQVKDVYIPNEKAGFEDDDSIEVEAKELAIPCIDKYQRFSYTGSKEEIRIPVPYRFLSSARPARKEDNIAFEIVISNGTVTTSRPSDSKLSVLSITKSSSNDISGLTVHIQYNARKFEFRVSR